MGFAGTLRSFLRHDPDVIMVGEIRDPDTADVALKAAVTGHLVFSTLHTNSAPAAVTRLADLGLPRFLIAATLRAVIAQRLARRLCERCRRPRPASADECALLKLPTAASLWEPCGCPACAGTGYRGRVGLFETLWIDATLTQLVAQGASEHELRQRARHFTSLWDDGQRKVIDGVTTLAELLRIATPEETT
jgi:type IV pilus assembly protein PilB